MNQAQRTFLIKKIETETATKVKLLRDSIPDHPNLDKYLLHAVMSGAFELQPIEHLRTVIKDKALNTKNGNSWLNNDGGWRSSGSKNVQLPIEDFFIVPEEYRRLKEEHAKKERAVLHEIGELEAQKNSLIVRIQLASDKTLQSMINEVDDMGDIKLMETVLRTGLDAGTSNKLLDK